MNIAVRRAAVVLFGALLMGGGFALIRSGLYGYTLFLVVPVLIGGLAAVVLQAQTRGQAARQGALVLLCMTGSLIVLGIEGLFCIAMTIPLSVPLGALGGALAFQLISARAGTGSVAMMMLLPAGSLTFDVTSRPAVFEVRTTVEIAAPAKEVWKHVIAFRDLPDPTEWYFRSGIAYPKRAWMAGSGVGAVRYCQFSTGPFVEPIQVWDEPRLLRFSVTESPAPMDELSPYADLVPRHLHGFFTSKQGQFRLTRLPGARTLLEGTTWYSHGLWPGQYWRWWSDAIIHRIHLRVLHHIRTLSE